MADINSIRSEDAPLPWRARPEPGYSEFTADRLRAYLASIKPLEGVADLADDERYQRGRSHIERLAIATKGTAWPTLRLTISQCADIAYFISESEPIYPASWWQDPKNAPSHICGYNMVLMTVADSLSASRGRA